jgi:hypothetical protein
MGDDRRLLEPTEQGFSVKLTTIPLNWDGRFVLLPPLKDEEIPDVQE